MEFKGKAALITGAGRGIGRGMARAFAEAGASVVIAERDVADGMEVARLLVADGLSAVCIESDVSLREDVEAAVARTVSEFGRIDILINNAGSLSPNVLLEQKADAMLEKTLKIGLWGTWWGMQAAFPHMRDQGGGRVINFYSGDAESGAWLHGDHNVVKSAIIGLTRSAAAEWGRHNILVNAISPAAAGTVFEEMKISDPDFVDRWCYQNPLGRMGDPQADIAPVAMFLASPAASYITGELIHVDGGQHLARRSSKPLDLSAYESAAD